MTTCAIIEDNRLDCESLRNLINVYFCEELALVGVAYSMNEGIELIRKKSPELVFLDIELPDQNGFCLLDNFPTACFDVIFTTSSEEYAISAIRYSAIDYFIKPIETVNLQQAVSRLNKNRHAHRKLEDPLHQLKMGISYQDKIALPVSDGFQVVQFNEILYCQASENYSYIFLVSGESFLITKTLKSIEESLAFSNFFRIHKSTLINLNYVKSFSRNIVTLENGLKFEIAARRQEEFINLFLHKNSKTQTKGIKLSGETLN